VVHDLSELGCYSSEVLNLYKSKCYWDNRLGLLIGCQLLKDASARICRALVKEITKDKFRTGLKVLISIGCSLIRVLA